MTSKQTHIEASCAWIAMYQFDIPSTTMSRETGNRGHRLTVAGSFVLYPSVMTEFACLEFFKTRERSRVHIRGSKGYQKYCAYDKQKYCAWVTLSLYGALPTLLSHSPRDYLGPILVQNAKAIPLRLSSDFWRLMTTSPGSLDTRRQLHDADADRHR